MPRREVLNQRAEAALGVAMDAPASLGDDDEDAWHSWYYERIGYRYTPPPKVVAAVNALPQMVPPRICQLLRGGHAGPHDRRPPADRNNPDRGPGSQPRRGDRCTGLPAGSGPASQSAG